MFIGFAGLTATRGSGCAFVYSVLNVCCVAASSAVQPVNGLPPADVSTTVPVAYVLAPAARAEINATAAQRNATETSAVRRTNARRPLVGFFIAPPLSEPAPSAPGFSDGALYDDAFRLFKQVCAKGRKDIRPS